MFHNFKLKVIFFARTFNDMHYYNYKISFRLLYYAIAIIASIVIFSLFVYYYTEYLWFESVGYAEVFVKSLQYMLSFYALVFSIIFITLILNNFAIRKATEEFLGEQFKIPYVVDFIISVLCSLAFLRYWTDFLYFVNSADFGICDPIFGLDSSFYVFKLPFLKIVLIVFILALSIAIIIAICSYLYVFRWVRSFEEFKEIFPQLGFTHLASIAALFLIIVSVFVFIQRYDLVYSQHGVLSGAGYVDVNMRIPILTAFSIMFFALSFISFYFIKKRKLEIFAYLILIIVVLYIIIALIFPFAIQKFQVEPNELAYESKYINYSIRYTLYAYGLDKVKRIPYNFTYNLTFDDVINNSATIRNVRIWDHRPILYVFRQLQQIRTYYVIRDVDVDRYWINESYVQVMIAARELSTDLLPTTAKTWLNRHLIYTHGYGLVAAPVNAVSKEGLPELILYDIPPKGEIKITRPEIYYGELTNDYVVVNTTQKEFDYPKGEINYYTKYSGIGGVKLDYFRKLLYSLRFSDPNLILSKYITDGSRLMLHRNIVDRAKTIAPFFEYDKDPYVAVINGRIYWIIDAYTKLFGFPYSVKINGFNYIRNPVKVFIDAYNGSVYFYVVQEDAFIKTLKKVFPNLFKYDMPEEFKRHIRYPRDYFEIQAKVFATYHMTDVTSFYNREDVWEIPKEEYENEIIEVEPYYVTLSIEDKPEFVLMLPFTPKGRDNLIAWMCARCDGNHYGELILYEFPKGELIYGPMQIDARIDQDAEISKLFTLWNQAGSRVIRGNLLVIPINNSIIYIEPVYLRATSAKIPELRGVIVAYDDILEMDSTLYDALEKVFGMRKETKEKEKVVKEKELIELLRKYYKEMIEALKSGNWTEFGEMFEKIGELLGVR